MLINEVKGTHPGDQATLQACTMYFRETGDCKQNVLECCLDTTDKAQSLYALMLIHTHTLTHTHTHKQSLPYTYIHTHTRTHNYSLICADCTCIFSYMYVCTGTIVGTSVLVFRASTWNDLGWTTAYILPAALLAFMLGVSEYLLVYHTSGLTLSISGVFKVCWCLKL